MSIQIILSISLFDSPSFCNKISEKDGVGVLLKKANSLYEQGSLFSFKVCNNTISMNELTNFMLALWRNVRKNGSNKRKSPQISHATVTPPPPPQFAVTLHTDRFQTEWRSIIGILLSPDLNTTSSCWIRGANSMYLIVFWTWLTNEKRLFRDTDRNGHILAPCYAATTDLKWEDAKRKNISQPK